MAPLDLERFLSSLDRFSGWPEDGSLAALAAGAEVWSFREGDLVRFPDEAAPGETWVAEGCLAVLEDEAPRYVGVRERIPADPGVWVRGQTAGRFVVLPEAAWDDWLRGHPEAAARLGEEVPPPLPTSLNRSPLVLEPGERLVHVFRKSPLFLLLRALVPSAFFVVFTAFGLFVQLVVQPSLPAWAVWLLPGIGMMITAALVALVSWEWASSVLAITDRSVLVRQIDVWTHRSDFEKLALDRVKEALYRRAGLWDTVLGLVSVEIEGDSPRGRLVFRGLPHGSRFLAAMEALRARRSSMSAGRTVIRRALAERSGGARSPVREQAPADRHARKKRLAWREEGNGMLRFRRHPWRVFRRSLPWLGWAALAVFLGVVTAVLAPGLAGTVAWFTAAAVLLPLARVGWEFWDWADDTLCVKGEQVVLVHRRPLGLGEVRQEGLLDQVEQVGVRKETLMALVLDFGVITINLGAETVLEFADAAHPEWVQNELFHRRTLLLQERERQAAGKRLDEVSEILDTWDEARKAGYFTEKS